MNYFLLVWVLISKKKLKKTLILKSNLVYLYHNQTQTQRDMKVQTKINRVEKQLTTDYNFSSEEAKKAIKETMRFFDLKKISPSYFTEALINTYNIVGVQR